MASFVPTANFTGFLLFFDFFLAEEEDRAFVDELSSSLEAARFFPRFLLLTLQLALVVGPEEVVLATTSPFIEPLLVSRDFVRDPGERRRVRPRGVSSAAGRESTFFAGNTRTSSSEFEYRFCDDSL